MADLPRRVYVAHGSPARHEAKEASMTASKPARKRWERSLALNVMMAHHDKACSCGQQAAEILAALPKQDPYHSDPACFCGCLFCAYSDHGNCICDCPRYRLSASTFSGRRNRRRRTRRNRGEDD